MEQPAIKARGDEDKPQDWWRVDTTGTARREINQSVHEAQRITAQICCSEMASETLWKSLSRTLSQIIDSTTNIDMIQTHADGNKQISCCPWNMVLQKVSTIVLIILAGKQMVCLQLGWEFTLLGFWDLLLAAVQALIVQRLFATQQELCTPHTGLHSSPPLLAGVSHMS